MSCGEFRSRKDDSRLWLVCNHLGASASLPREGKWYSPSYGRATSKVEENTISFVDVVKHDDISRYGKKPAKRK